MATSMQLRIHSYGHDPDYHATLSYYRDAAWNDLTSRLVTNTTNGQRMPIRIQKGYRQIYTCKLTLDNEDGLLTPENTASSLNQGGTPPVYNVLLGPSRKVRIAQGIQCYASLTSGKTVTASTAPTAGALSKLVDGVYGDATDKADTDWVHWSAVASGGTVWVKIDLGSAQTVRHGCLSFLSMSNTTPQIELPSTVQFAYSTDDSTYTNIGSAFDMSEYNDSLKGQQFLAWFTDLDTSARYIRATITNIAEENELYIDEFELWGGSTTSFQSITTFTGYLGDQMDFYSQTGFVDISFEDTRKKEADNRAVELTQEYQGKRPEEIIYDLLTNPMYWTEGDVNQGNNLVVNGGFEVNDASWTESALVGRRSARSFAHSGKIIMEYQGATAQYCEQGSIAVTGSTQYIVKVWYASNTNAELYIEITPNVGSVTRYPTGVTNLDWNTANQWKAASFTFTTDPTATSVTIRITRAAGAAASAFTWIDDVSIKEVFASTSNYSAALESTEIGWAADENISNFDIPKWQGQNGTILDYCNELAKLMGFVYDADGDGVRQFWEPEHGRTTASNYLNYFDTRQIGPEPIQRTKSDRDIVNVLKIVGYESGNKEVQHKFRQEDSISRYGFTRYARWTEPLVQNEKVAKQLAKSIFRDYAYARDIVQARVVGDFDLDRPKRICTFKEQIRAYIDKTEKWAIESFDMEMVSAGRGYYRTNIQARKYMSNQPAVVSTVAGTGGNTNITVSWAANTEADISGYYVYYATAADGTFIAEALETGTSHVIPGLVNGTAYWFYVVARNQDLIDSLPSALVRCLAGVGNSGSESTTWGTGFASLAAAITNNDPSVTLDLSWTPTLAFNPDKIRIDLLGPSLNSPPLEITGYADLTPATTVAEHYYRNYRKADYAASSTFYWRLAMKEVVIDDKHYYFGSPLYSSAASVAWPA